MKLSQKEKTRIKEKYGPWSLVTGASSGIGKDLAHRLAECGLNLLVVSRDEKKLKQLASEIKEQHNVEVQIFPCDLSDEVSVNELIGFTNGMEIGSLVASAGFGTSGKFLNQSIHEEVNMIQVNCIAAVMLAHHFAQQFAQQKRGGIILMSSLVAFQGVPFASNYAATKAYIQSLAEGLAIELKPHNVDVLAAAPGPVSSGFGTRANMKMSQSLTPSQVGLPILKSLGRKTTVLPGFLTKLLVYSLRTVPRWAKVRIMKEVMGGMTKHQIA